MPATVATDMQYLVVINDNGVLHRYAKLTLLASHDGSPLGNVTITLVEQTVCHAIDYDVWYRKNSNGYCITER